MLRETAISEVPIEMMYCEAPNAGPDAHNLWDEGIDQKTKMGATKARVLEAPLDEEEALKVAIADSFGFIVMWGRKAGNLTAIACLSNYLLGFNGKNPQKQLECGKDILLRIVSPGDATFINYGPHKYVAYLETDLDEETMLGLLLNSQSAPISQYFTDVKREQRLIDLKRRQELIDLEEGSYRPFVSIFRGEVSPRKRAFQKNGKHYFDYGYEEEDEDFFSINPDNKKQALSELYNGATLDETGQMLKDIANFFKGQRGRNRFVFQLDFGADAACCNIAFNAQQNTSISELGSLVNRLNLGIWEPNSEGSVSSNIPSTILEALAYYRKNETNNSQNFCQKCKKSRNENGCSCNKDNNSDHLN